MPINNIPGVGPTNADIATAVAAPSAATIAAAVAAPSSATIASAVAAAVPTLSQINTSVSSNAPSPNNWTVITSYSPNSTTNTYTWSGLSGYKVYRLLFVTAVSGAANVQLRFNSDAGNNYDYAGTKFASGITMQDALNATQLAISASADNTVDGDFTINFPTLSTMKSVFGNTYHRSGGSTVAVATQGYWRSTSAITSITLFTGATSFTNGNIVLLGGN